MKNVVPSVLYLYLDPGLLDEISIENQSGHPHIEDRKLPEMPIP